MRCRAELCPFWTGDGCSDGVLIECPEDETEETPEDED
jgi:hypothetical protein